MSTSKKFLIAIISLLIPFGVASAAQAAGETASASTSLTPRSGQFYKTHDVSSNLKMDVKVHAGEGQSKVLPMKNVKMTFPAGMRFNPGNMPVCPDSKLNEQSSLGNPGAIVADCKGAVVGTGTATILLFQAVAAPLTDPILVAFNAGKNASGQPKIKILGYSQGTGVGVLMTGTLKGRVLDIAIPVLSYDSATSEFSLSFPGGQLKRPELNINTKGQNPNYVQARCNVSPQVTNAEFELGTRDPATGEPTSPTETVNAPTTQKNCVGQAYKPKLGGVSIKGPAAVKNGKKGTYKVTVKSTGNAPVNNVVVTSNRGGKVKLGTIAHGKKKVATIKVKINGRKGKKVNVKFTAKAGNAKAVSKAKMVRVK